MHDELLDTIRKAFTVGGDDAKRNAVAALELLLGALGAAPSNIAMPPIATGSAASSAPLPTMDDRISIALDAVIAKFRSMLPPGVETPAVESYEIPFVPVPTWNNG